MTNNSFACHDSLPQLVNWPKAGSGNSTPTQLAASIHPCPLSSGWISSAFREPLFPHNTRNSPSNKFESINLPSESSYLIYFYIPFIIKIKLYIYIIIRNKALISKIFFIRKFRDMNYIYLEFIELHIENYYPPRHFSSYHT